MSGPHSESVHSSRRRVRLVHTSDIHLQSDVKPDLVERSFWAAMQAVSDTGADALVITGDLFETNRVSAKTIDLALAGLRTVPVSVVLLPGNHDAYDETSVYRRVDFEAEVPGLKVLRDPGGELVRIPELMLTLWGRPTVSHEPSFLPINGIPLRDDHSWHVALAHGHFTEKPPALYSSPIFADEVRRLDWDYLALGHVHVHCEVSRGSTPAHYSGSPVGNMLADQLGSVQLVTLDPAAGVTVTRWALDHNARPGRTRPASPSQAGSACRIDSSANKAFAIDIMALMRKI
ncbi:MAG: metallophosphoesterase family protein [Bacillota bacterium]